MKKDQAGFVICKEYKIGRIGFITGADVKKYLIIAALFNLIFISVSAQEKNPLSGAVQEKDLTLSVIGSGIDLYKGKEQTMSLRLRNVDTVMEKAWFYDSENVDIVFDITGYDKNQKLAASFADAHPGVVYKVVFIPESMPRDGVITGKLISFTPLFLEKI